MKFTKDKIEFIKNFLIDNIENHPDDIVSFTIKSIEIGKPTVLKYLRELVNENFITAANKGQKPSYKLKEKVLHFNFINNEEINEEQAWNEIRRNLSFTKSNVSMAWDYCFSEMMNNAIEHSEAKNIEVIIKDDAVKYTLIIIDDGVGIFDKICKDAGLYSPRESILELAKGKFTSDSTRHSGEGIFFTSRICDKFAIFSKNLTYSLQDGVDFLLEDRFENLDGTAVFMTIYKNSSVNTKKVFDDYTEGAGTAFSKTVIPVKLMQYEGISLVSRSQARRLITRFNKFSEVVLDFSGIEFIGQAFADEVFRVFKNSNPTVNLTTINCIKDVSDMIKYVQSQFFQKK